MRGAVFVLLLMGIGARADEAGVEFFEARIRPVLVEQCYACHNSRDKTEGGLALDDRAGLLEGGNSGPAVVPGEPGKSLLIRAIRHASGKLRMPKENGKLADPVIADFETWVKLGAPDPRDHPPEPKELAALTSWEAVRALRAQWWSFRPVTRPEVPEARGESAHPVDRFLRARLDREGLAPAGPADRPTLIRRVSFALNGLPPTPDELDRFIEDDSPRAYEELVERLLQSPRFGETWARHAMDWMRYAESHGSEGDPAIPHAWRYRDYLIRALNDDVPYDRLVREQVAGDLLPDPRVNRDLSINESALGIGHYRMVAHGYAPTEALEEQVTFTDNQVDVLTKAFLGLTVSCARCHNHKFDAIGQADFYALYGVLASCRPALITVDTPERLDAQKTELRRLRDPIRHGLADAWRRALDEFPALFRDVPLSPEFEKRPDHPLHPWAKLRSLDGAEFAQGWDRLRTAAEARRTRPPLRWDLTSKVDHAAWFQHGNGLPDRPAPPGEFHVRPEGDPLIANIYPAGVYTHALSSKHNGVLTSPTFTIDSEKIAMRVAGGGGARVRLVVRNYPRAIGLIYKFDVPECEEPRWIVTDTRYWKGESAHIEVATAGDLPVEAVEGAERSWFGITEVIGLNGDEAPPSRSSWSSLLAGEAPRSPSELAARYTDALRRAIDSWEKDTATDDQALYLGAVIRGGLLPNARAALPRLAFLFDEYRRIEAQVPVPTRAPGVLEGTVSDQPLMVRGNPKTLGDPVPRRFLEVLDARPFPAGQSGRRELAEAIVAPGNPLASRVIVNRLWHHLFGRGIVATPDNFGHLGAAPSHPELLDYLASRFVSEGWSIKGMIRLLVTSGTYQSESHPTPASAGRDPTNALLSHFPVRRLEAEAIRDSLLAVSGRLDETRYGPPVSGRDRRRSVYVRVVRNNLDPFLNTFDAPEPLTTRGRRDTTNVPAQSLTLLNDPWVLDLARRWGETLGAQPIRDDEPAVIRRMFLTALGRPPTADDVSGCIRYLADQEAGRVEARRARERLNGEIRIRQGRIAVLTAPVRARLESQAESPSPRAEPPLPMARWEFDGDLRDALGALHGTAHGSARVEGGALMLDGSSYVETSPLTRKLGPKTLEAWVTLDDDNQRGSGVLTVETIGGGTFDALVFAEQAPREWLAGSNFFLRTKPFQGPPETDATRRPVHLALVYEADGTIRGYRDGVSYGVPYPSKGPVAFEAGASRVLFGLRHSPAGGNKMLRGKVLRAQLYDRPLSAEEVAVSAASQGRVVTETQVLAALPEAGREEIAALRREIDALTVKVRASETATDDPSNEAAARRQDLAHALWNLKEFLYVR